VLEMGLSKDKRDIFYRLAKEKDYRARSAFKLLQIDQEFNVLKDANKIVDLCAAPGGWTQVLRENNKDAKIVAVDLQAMSPIENVVQIQGDITSTVTIDKIIKIFEGDKADLVCCDGAPDAVGLADFDEFIQHDLVLSAFRITSEILKSGGTFIAKVFRGKDTYLLYKQLSCFFENVLITKPRCSRNSSIEAFIFCEKLSLTNHLEMDKKLKEQTDLYYTQMFNEEYHANIQFRTAIGNYQNLDPDMNYPLDVSI